MSYETGVMEVNDDGGAVSDYKFARYDSGNGMSLTTIPEDELGSYKIIVNNSALYGNFAKGMGGAIAASAGAEINSSTLAYNIAGAGGALALDFNVNGSTIAYNVALGHYQEFYSREGDNKIVLEYSGVIDGGAAFGVEMEFDSEGERHFVSSIIGKNYSINYSSWNEVDIGKVKLYLDHFNVYESDSAYTKVGVPTYGSANRVTKYHYIDDIAMNGQLNRGEAKPLLFFNGVMQDFGGWTKTLSIRGAAWFDSVAFDGVYDQTTGTDQRGYGVANGYRDIGAFEASGTYAYANGRGYSSIAELLARPEAATDGVFNITLADTRITDRNIRLDGKINITGGVDADGNVLTYFDANNLGRVFNITSEAAMVSLSNLILMNGAAMKTSVLGSDGGGLIANSGNLTLTNITGKNSFAQNAGGAVYSTLNLVVNDSLFSNNRANVGGGIYASGTSVTAKDVTFFANYGHNGGGMYVQNLNFTGSGLVFNNNYATNDAGGLYIVGDDTTVIDIASSFKENYVLGRGAAMNMLGGATFKGNLDVSNNISIFDGGGIYMLNTSEIDISGNFRGNRSGFGIGGGAYIGNVVKSLRLFADFK
ncbi:MAG: hypothetical protein RRY34_07465, partial [Victivallaceae bacterium]